MEPPFSQACENNKNPILEVIQRYFCGDITVWEIGSGTGQHAVHFASHLPHLHWQPTDQGEYLRGIQLRLEQAKLDNINPALPLNVFDHPWPSEKIEAVFSANTLHIMSWQAVETFFQRLGEYLQPDGIFCCYGPFNYHGQFTSASNQNFDLWLKNRDPKSGIRDFEAVCELAQQQAMTLLEDVAMPANNRLLVWKKAT